MENQRIDVLNHGYVRLIDHMGDDLSVVRAARTSYDAEWRAGEDEGKDNKLIDYLLRNRHCYHPDMEVLTIEGWKAWKDCNSVETFVIPDPTTHTTTCEALPLEVFHVSDLSMCCMESDRMSYCVTPEHRLWVKPKRYSEYSVSTAESFTGWGNFEPMKGYGRYGSTGASDSRYQFLGFYLGDGSYASTGTVTFHLRKSRKQLYIERLLHDLNIPYMLRQSNTCKGARVYSVSTPEWLKGLLGPYLKCRADEKNIVQPVALMSGPQVRGLLDGLINSDGSVSSGRPQTQYTSTSPHLTELFVTLASTLGLECHYSHKQRDQYRATIYHGERTTLECRGQYLSRTPYSGNVYCTTSSSGFLLVRGGSDKFGMVCGNSTPFEAVTFTWELKSPIFVFRQLHRHRTQSISEISARYCELPEEYYIPEVSQITHQHSSNKQMRDDVEHLEAIHIQDIISTSCQRAFYDYHHLLKMGTPRELARTVLPVGTYSRMFTTMNLHNFMHMAGLRLHEHAQYEVQVFVQAMLDLIEPIVPHSIAAFKKHALHR